jgi:NADH-quinone oxidoreductase subunit F
VDFTRPADKCIGCGTCAAVCPTGAIRIVDEGNTRRLVLTGTVIQELELLPCEGCGRPWFSRAYLDWVAERQVGIPGARIGGRTCPDCASKRRAPRARPSAPVPFPRKA